MAYGNYAPFYRPGYFNPMQPSAPTFDNQIVQPYQQPMQTQTPLTVNNQPNNEMLWVLNENEATSYPVAPNNSVVLWDKNNPTIYVKSVNAQGVPSMRILDFAERTDNANNKVQNSSAIHECTCGDKFATKEQMDDLQSKINDLAAKYEELARPVVEKPKSTSKKAKEGDE